MGNYFAVNMEDNFKQNQDFITEMNTVKLERQLLMRHQMRKREIALQIAKARELFFWFGAFYITSVSWACLSFRKNKNSKVFVPLLPLTFIMAYQTDMAYGTKLRRILAEAEHIMQFESELLALPLGVPSASSIDMARSEIEEQKRLHPLNSES